MILKSGIEKWFITLTSDRASGDSLFRNFLAASGKSQRVLARMARRALISSNFDFEGRVERIILCQNS
jgi:hypothetical protein